MSRTVLAAVMVLSLLACDSKNAPPGAASESARPSPPAAPKPGGDVIPRATASAFSSAAPARSAAAPVPAPADVASPPTGAKTLPSGLASKVLKKGTGKTHPRPEDRVSVHYTGWTRDGAMFDTSTGRAEPATFAVSGVIKGWTEGLQLMVVGERRRLWVPADLAYGERARRPGAPSGPLTFDVELVAIKTAPKPPTVPEDLQRPPPNATKTATGLVYRVLTKGSGTVHPGATARAKVHYSGWTLDGKMFDSSVPRDEPAVFALDRVIKGWTEGVQLMVVGDKYRFWIPAELAYGEKPARPGDPAGTLVFDIELLELP